MKYAIVEIGGKQLKIEEGSTFEIERQSEPLAVSVLLYSDGKEILVGNPDLKEVEVKASVISEKRASKIRIGRFKSKSRYRKIKGHKQPLSVVGVSKITLKGAAKATSSEEKETKKKVAEPKAPKVKEKKVTAPKSSKKETKK